MNPLKRQLPGACSDSLLVCLVFNPEHFASFVQVFTQCAIPRCYAFPMLAIGPVDIDGAPMWIVSRQLAYSKPFGAVFGFAVKLYHRAHIITPMKNQIVALITDTCTRLSTIASFIVRPLFVLLTR